MKKPSLALTLVVVAVPALANAATRVSSDSNCPSSDAISQRLLGLLAAGGPAISSARVRTEGESLRIELATPGEANRERTVPGSGDCEARAEMAALIIAAWLDAMPVGTISTPGVPPREPPPVPRQTAEPDPLEEPASPPLSLGTRTLVGAGLFGLADSLGASPGFALAAAMPNLLELFGWTAEVSLSLPRQISVGQGTAHYWRPTFGLAATGEIRAKNWAVRPQAGAVLGILLVNGTGYVQNTRSTTVTWGAGAGVALARSWRRNELWLRLDALLWPQGRSVRSKQTPVGSDIEVALPEWESRLAAGFSWGIH
jgi:hypothetical protein